MRAWLVILALSTAVDAEPVAPARWQQSANAPSIFRVWGTGSELYGVGPAGTHRSTDGGATWTPADKAGRANGVWGTAADDVWVVRDRSVHHSVDGAGAYWTNQLLPVSMSTKLEGIWGAGDDRYVFGGDRSLRAAVLLHSRDRGQSWQLEDIAGERIAGMWGRGDERYAVGSRGVLRFVDGWTIVHAGSFEAIWGDAKTIYAVGANGAIVSSDGKSWTRRSSGVTYTLSSIVGSSGEIFAGSLDGAPLRSTDGVTWKPLTAMVPKGNVWGAGRSVVAAASELRYFSDAAVSSELRPVQPELRALAARFATYPAAMELLEEAAHRLDPRYGSPARVPKAGVEQAVLERDRDAALAAASNAEERIEAHARYVLDGGKVMTSHMEVATAFGKPMSWEGFSWRDAFVIATPSAMPKVECKPLVVDSEDQLATTALQSGSYAVALGHYRNVWPCRPSAMSRAYLAACKTHAFADAQQLFTLIGKPALAQICIKDGYDPRQFVPPPARVAP